MDIKFELINEHNFILFVPTQSKIIDEFNEYNSLYDVPIKVSVELSFINLNFFFDGYLFLNELVQIVNIFKNQLNSNLEFSKFKFLEIDLELSLYGLSKNSYTLEVLVLREGLKIAKTFELDKTYFMNSLNKLESSIKEFEYFSR